MGRKDWGTRKFDAWILEGRIPLAAFHPTPAIHVIHAPTVARVGRQVLLEVGPGSVLAIM
jgi:hypothetical protein